MYIVKLNNGHSESVTLDLIIGGWIYGGEGENGLTLDDIVWTYQDM